MEFIFKTTRLKFEVPHLEKNMRNSRNVFETFDILFPNIQESNRLKNLRKMKLGGTELKTSCIPCNTVEGCRTIIVPVVDKADSEAALKHVMSTYFMKGEPVCLLSVDQSLPQAEQLLSEGHDVVRYSSTENVSQLKEYIKNPRGILMLLADDFSGMQSRNLIIMDSRKSSECNSPNLPLDIRNYILRGNSFVVMIINEAQINDIESLLESNSVSVDNFQWSRVA